MFPRDHIQELPIAGEYDVVVAGAGMADFGEERLGYCHRNGARKENGRGASHG